jgi:hypothetical protein
MKGKTIRKGSPKRKLGANIMKMLDDLKESENDVFKGYTKNHNMTYKSCIWELLYVKALILPHNINLMHQEWNIAKSIISMYLDVTGVTKDNINVRLKQM